MSQTQYPFLSPDWIVEVKKLRDSFSGEIGEPVVDVKFNINVEKSPHHNGDTIEAHIDTSKGQMMVDSGHMDGAELTVTIDYGTAKAMFIARNPSVVMEAFFAGKILVEGDASKLPILMAQNVNPPVEALEMMAKVEAITAED